MIAGIDDLPSPFSIVNPCNPGNLGNSYTGDLDNLAARMYPVGQSLNERLFGFLEPSPGWQLLPMKKELIELRVNGRRHELAIEPSELLLDVLRQELQLTGSKRGCDDSSCGACTVLVDGVPVLSCTMLAMSCAADEQDGPDITTVEG